MRRIAIATILLLILTCFVGCSKNEVGSSKTTQPDITTTESTTVKPKVKSLTDYQETTISNVCSFHIEGWEISNKVLPPNPGNSYYVFEAENGRKYVDVIFSYKNLSSSAIMADDTIPYSILIYDGKYEYSGSLGVEIDNRSDFALFASSTAIEPLTSAYIHLMFQVPDEVADSMESINVMFKIKGDTFVYNVQ